MLCVVLGVVSATAGEVVHDPDWDAWKLPPLPHFGAPPGEDFYPPEAEILGVEGRVLLAFDITTEGKARNISILWSENKRLAAGAAHALSTVHFDVPADWAASGAWRRWRLGFVFRLVPRSQVSSEFPIPVEVVTVTSSRVTYYFGRLPPEH